MFQLYTYIYTYIHTHLSHASTGRYRGIRRRARPIAAVRSCGSCPVRVILHSTVPVRLLSGTDRAAFRAAIHCRLPLLLNPNFMLQNHRMSGCFRLAHFGHPCVAIVIATKRTDFFVTFLYEGSPDLPVLLMILSSQPHRVLQWLK
jgi:hypothetical protein